MINDVDIACITECWIAENDEIDINGFYSQKFHRKKGKGGGMVLLIKNDFKKHVELVENVKDTILVVKVKNSKIEDKPIFLLFCYIPPEGSVFYRREDVDLFNIMTELIGKYENFGNVFLAGDLNARCGTNNDFIVNDTLIQNISDLIQPLSSYDFDSDNTDRKSEDKGVNQFGRSLLNLCKSTGYRIVNGRHSDDSNGSVTFYGANGFSLIDYLICRQKILKYVTYFSSGVFSPLSDHSPLNFKLNCTMSQKNYSQVLQENINVNVRCESKNLRWRMKKKKISMKN